MARTAGIPSERKGRFSGAEIVVVLIEVQEG
jgi:hypothetical protein